MQALVPTLMKDKNAKCMHAYNVKIGKIYHRQNCKIQVTHEFTYLVCIGKCIHTQMHTHTNAHTHTRMNGHVAPAVHTQMNGHVAPAVHTQMHGHVAPAVHT